MPRIARCQRRHLHARAGLPDRQGFGEIRYTTSIASAAAGYLGVTVTDDNDELLDVGLENELLEIGLPEFSARLLCERKNVFEVDLDVDMSPDGAAERARQILDGQGRVVLDEAVGDAVTQIMGMTGAGFGNLHPVVVTLTIRPAEYGSRVTVRGAAKEPLIKQRAGEAAAKRVAAALAALD